MAREGEPRDGEQTGALSASRVVLVVVGEPARCGELVGALQERGLPAVPAVTASLALFWARELGPAFVLLSMHARGSRILLGEFRRAGRQVVVLTEHPDERVWALDMGCLDALPHSLDPEELAAKVLRLARSHRVRPQGRVVAGPLEVDSSARLLVWKNRPVAVSPLLFDLAVYLATRAGQLTPTRVLLEDVWGEPLASPHKVHLAVHRLRRRLGEPTNSHFLVGRRGHGYGIFPDASGFERTPTGGFPTDLTQSTKTRPNSPKP